MTIDKMRVTCDKGHVSDVEVVTNAPVAVAIASMQAARCAVCGSQKLGLGGSYDDAPSIKATVEERAGWWAHRGERGVSSNTIYSVLAHGYVARPDTPYDPDDFRRCKQLLDLIPEWRTSLGGVAKTYPWFKPFTDRWDEMERLYAEESPTGSCPKLYDLMQVARQESQSIRGRK